MVRIHLPPAKSLLRTCGYVDPCRRDGLFAVAVDNCQSWLKLLNAPSQNHLQIAPSPKAVSTALAISPSISSLYHLDPKPAKPEPNRRPKTKFFLGRAGNFG